MKTNNNTFFGNLKSVLIAVFIALLIRSFIAEPFNIPSGSMKPNLLVGDFIFVSKWSYGYSRHSLPFSLGWSDKKIFSKMPKRGDVVVFKTPEDNRTDYIKRVIGLPGDSLRIKNGQIILNDEKILRKRTDDFIDNDNKITTSRPLLNNEIYNQFKSALKERSSRGHFAEITFIGVNSAIIKEHKKIGKILNVTVDFIAEVITCIRDKDKKIVSGDPEKIKKIYDTWVFSRDITSSNPNWQLVNILT